MGRTTTLLGAFCAAAVFMNIAVAQPPTAPPPRPVPTAPDDIILGRWKLINHSLLATVKSEQTYIYNDDGVYRILKYTPDEHTVVRGRYSIRGKVFAWVPDGDTPGRPEPAEARIVEITRDTVTFEGLGRFAGQKSTYQRVKD